MPIESLKYILGLKVHSDFHEHDLVYGGNHYNTRCDVCGLNFDDTACFHCALCEYDVCVSCFESNKSIIKSPDKNSNIGKLFNSKKHEHLLIYGANNYHADCDLCSKNLQKHCSYCCPSCHYDCCDNCFDGKEVIW